MPHTAVLSSWKRLWFLPILIISSLSCRSSDVSVFLAEDGILDLRNADVDGKTFSLDGEWKFFWKEFLLPDAEAWGRPGITRARIPGTWNDVEIDGDTLPDTGYCSMQLRVLLPPNIGEMGIKVNNVSTAYRLYVDDDLLIENGKAGTCREDSMGRYQPRTVYFDPRGTEVTFTLHISNFHDRVGGAWTRMYIGNAEGISKKHYIDGSFDMLLFGMYLIMSAYYLISWYFGGRKKAFLWFSLSALMIAFRTLSAGEIYFMTLFPRLGFEINHKIQLGSQPALVAFFLLSLKNVFPREISPIVVKITLFIMLLYGVIIAAFPLILHSYLLFPFHVVVMILGGYLTIEVFFVARKNRPGGKILFIGFLVLFITTINDIFYSVSVIYTGYLVPFGIVFFSITYIITLTKHKAEQEIFPDDVTDERVLPLLKEKGISNREGEVLMDLLQGLSYDDIAEKLFISKSTVTKHVHSIYQKLGTKNRVGLYDFVKNMLRNLEN